MKPCKYCNQINGHHSDNCPTHLDALKEIPPPTTEEAELSIWSTSKEDDLWRDLFDDLFNGRIGTEEIKHKYSISRRSEQNSEAIEFGYWLHKHDHGSDNHDRIDKLYEQFQLFKKQNQ